MLITPRARHNFDAFPANMTAEAATLSDHLYSPVP